MFTGIVEEVGKVRYIQLNGNSGVLAVKAAKVLEGTKIGDSIAVNGVCLTVTSLQPDVCVGTRLLVCGRPAPGGVRHPQSGRRGIHSLHPARAG